MKGTKKALSILITVIMLMQMIPVMASGVTVTDLTWGDEWTYGAPTFHVSAEGSVELSLYKDGKVVDSTWYYVDDWEAREFSVYMFYAYKMVDLGPGTYHFTVTPYNDETEEYYETYTSPVFNYNPPKTVTTKPVLTYDGSKLDWDVSGDEASFGLVGYLTYGDGVYYDLMLYELEMSNYTIEEDDMLCFEEIAQLWYEIDPDKYPISKARYVWAVYAVPFDRTQMEMSKSDYVDVTDSKPSTPPSGDGEDTSGIYWDEEEFGTIHYSAYEGSAFHKVVLDNGKKTYSQTRSTSPEDDKLDLRMSASIARTGSGTYTPTITYYVSRADQTVLHTATGPSITYTEPTANFNPLPTMSGGNGYIQFANYEDIYEFFFQEYVEYSHTGERVALYGQGAPVFFIEEDGKFYIRDYELEQYNSKLEEMYAKDPVKYDKNKAHMVLDVTAYADDIRVYKPYKMGEVIVNIGDAPDDGGEDDYVPVDRSSVSDDYYDGAKVVYDLGIMPDVYKNPQEAITWDDLAPALIAIMGGEGSADALKDKVIFSDTEKGTYLNGCINYLYNIGIIAGMGDGTVGINNPIQQNHVVKYLVEILGYSPYAKEMGGYPTGYLATAQRIGVTVGVSVAGESTPTVEQLAQMIANSLEVGLMEQTGWGTYGDTYEITDNTLLYELGYAKVYANLTIDTAKAAVVGRAYDLNYLTGKVYSNTAVELLDKEILDLDGKGVKLYMKDDKAYTGFEYKGGEVIINDGAKETTDPTVKVEVYGYSYTKYKIGDGKYKALPSGIFEHTFDKNDGNKTLTVTIANADESDVKTIKASIYLDHKHTVVYKANGEEISRQEVGVGGTISLPQYPKIEGYKFNGWTGVPAGKIMPDKDVVITADVTKLAKIAGVVLHNGNPLANSEITMLIGGAATHLGYTDSTGAFAVYSEPCEAMIKIDGGWTTGDNTIPVVVGTKDIELGTINLDNTSLNALVSSSAIKYIDIPASLITKEDKDYASQSQYNTVEVIVQATSGGYIPEFADTIKNQYPDYTQGIGSVDVRVVKTTSGATYEQTEITEIDELMAIRMEIDEDLKHKSDFIVLRRHDGQVNVLTTTPNADGEYIEVDGYYITVYAKKFSEYSIGGTGLRFGKVYAKSFDYTDKKVVEITLGSENENKDITIGDTTLYYAPQRDLYIGIVGAENVGAQDRALNGTISDTAPQLLVYGNVDGKYNYSDISQAVSSGDLLNLKVFLTGRKQLADRSLLAADLNGDGRVTSVDILSMKIYMASGIPFPILK